MENDVSTWCSPYLDHNPLVLLIPQFGLAEFTESNVAKDRICCSLHGYREQREDILNSFGKEKKEAITILKLET
jgi:hypothetical protein